VIALGGVDAREQFGEIMFVIEPVNATKPFDEQRQVPLGSQSHGNDAL
jgi:hypothetical protein